MDVLALSALVGFAATFAMARWWERAAREKGLVGKDINKYGQPEVPEAGGISALAGFSVSAAILALFFALQGNTFASLTVLAALGVFLLGGFMGIVDDFMGWKSGLSQGIKPVLMLFAGLPLTVVAFFVWGHSSLLRFFPFDRELFKWLYVFFLVPVGVSGAANAINLYAGYDGLLPASLIVLFAALGIKAAVSGNVVVLSLCVLAISALLAFLWYNKYPARLFPGNVLPFSFGALFAAATVIGGYELMGMFLILPQAIETILHARRWFKVENFGIAQPDGTITPRYDKIYSLAHVLHRMPGMTEKKITATLVGFQIVVALVALWIFVIT